MESKMKRMYAPWRHKYVTDTTKQPREGKTSKKDCIFCNQFQANDDDKYFIIKRFSNSAIMMNYYPYNVGHIMVLPYEHKGILPDLTSEVRAEIMEVISVSTKVLEETLITQSFNIGINLGIAGGGGIPSHLHIHMLPRWLGDTNFLETIGQTKLISADFEKTFKDLKKGFARINL